MSGGDGVMRNGSPRGGRCGAEGGRAAGGGDVLYR